MAYPFIRVKPESPNKMREPPDFTQNGYDYPDESAFSSLESSIASLRDYDPPVDPVTPQNTDLITRNHPISSIRTASAEENVPTSSKKRKVSEFEFGTTLTSDLPTIPPVFGINYRINIPSRNVPQSNNLFIKQILPHPEQEALRRHLENLLTQMWWISNEMEPNGAFSPFIEKIEDHRFRCIFCVQVHSRSDRAIAHCRKHLDHRPFACPGGCRVPFEVCTARFFTKECLMAHRKQEKRVCSSCGLILDKKNLKRHYQSNKCSRIMHSR